MLSRSLVFPTALAATLCLSLSCARVPKSGVIATGALLRVTFKVRGAIDASSNPSYYFILLNPVDAIGDPGPSPVVTRPWGNGFAAASQAGAQGFTGFIRYDRFQGLGGYNFYKVAANSDGTLFNPVTGIFTLPERPDSVIVPQPGESELSFQLDLARLPKPPGVTGRFLQVNIVATNNLPQGNDDAEKLWDALGDGTDPSALNAWITIPADQNVTRTNAETLPILEPTRNDVRDHQNGPIIDDPAIDIVDWSIELRQPTR
jgi:hypothetical protein